jgi:hypothetical protein
VETGRPGGHQSLALHRQVVESVGAGQVEGDSQQLQPGPGFALPAQQVHAADEGVQRGARHLPRTVVRRQVPAASRGAAILRDAAGHRSQRLELDGAGDGPGRVCASAVDRSAVRAVRAARDPLDGLAGTACVRGAVNRGGAQRSLSRGQERVIGGGFAEHRQGAPQRGMFAG